MWVRVCVYLFTCSCEIMHACMFVHRARESYLVSSSSLSTFLTEAGSLAEPGALWLAYMVSLPRDSAPYPDHTLSYVGCGVVTSGLTLAP